MIAAVSHLRADHSPKRILCTAPYTLPMRNEPLVKQESEIQRHFTTHIYTELISVISSLRQHKSGK
ncbi:hypothetical protein PsAD26_02533 [Pseudovibrio sp. Ad26]|nr:hypothetical protein PsAD26_02533 [Pseudovibrio sp. Ad26]